MDQMSTRSSGYTLIELLVNLAIIGILTGISISTYMTYKVAFRLRLGPKHL